MQEELDPQPVPTEPAFTAGEDPTKATQAKKKADKRKAQRAQKAVEDGRVPNQAGRRPGPRVAVRPRNFRDEQEAAFELYAQDFQHDFVSTSRASTTCLVLVLMLVDMSLRSLPKDLAWEFQRVMMHGHDDGKSSFYTTKLRELYARMDESTRSRARGGCSAARAGSETWPRQGGSLGSLQRKATPMHKKI